MFRLFRSFAAIFKPPFEGLGLITILYIVWAHIVFPHNDLLRGNLPDPDDYMYLTQVLDWIKGQSWYDNIQYRLDPPTGTPIPFSRLAQLPLATGILFFHWLGLPLRGAATITALIEPLLLFGWLLVTLRQIMVTLIPPRWAGASAYVTLFSVALLFEFMPGHVDHHGLVIILMMASLAYVLRLLEPPHDAKHAVLAGIILALGMMVALECLPWVLLVAAFLGLWVMVQGGDAARNCAAFGLAFFIGSGICLVFTRPPSSLMEQDILTYSIAYVFLAASIALPFVGVALTASLPPWRRWVTGLVLALISSGFFLHRFPEMVTGPYGGIDPQLQAILLDAVDEAKSLWGNEHGWVRVFAFMQMSLLALPLSARFAWRGQGVERWKWSLIAAMLASAIALTIFYQYRFLGMSCALAIIPLTALACKGWAWIAKNLSGRPKVFAEIGLLLLIGPLPAVIVPALFDSRSFNVGMFLFPVDAGHSPCDMAKLEQILRDPNALGDKKHLILNMEGNGPELLFRTDHKVLAAPFHMDVMGNLDSARFFSTVYDTEAENIARRRGVDLVIACRFVPEFYLAAKKSYKGDDKNRPMPIVDRMLRGAAPSWMERIPEPDLDNFMIFKIRPPQSSLPSTVIKKNPR